MLRIGGTGVVAVGGGAEQRKESYIRILLFSDRFIYKPKK
jgi:hypothetical protein